MKLLQKAALLLATAWFTAITAAGQPDQATQKIFTQLWNATLANDYEAFVAVSDAAVKAALTKPMLEGLSQQIKLRAEKGCDAAYLGEMNQKGMKVHLWRLRFKDGGDDVLATLSVKDGKAGGFFLH